MKHQHKIEIENAVGGDIRIDYTIRGDEEQATELWRAITDKLQELEDEHGGEDSIVGIKQAQVYFDGASRGNPGPAAIGWLIVTDNDFVMEGSDRIGETTNNRAEYAALIRALEVAIDSGFEAVEIHGDSKLVGPVETLAEKHNE